MGSTHSFLATQGLPHTGVSVISPSTLLRLPAALYGTGPALSAVPVYVSSTRARIRLRLRVVSSPASAAQAPRGLAPSPRVQRAFSLCGPSACRRSGLRKSLDRNRGPVCHVGGSGFTGAEFSPFPSPHLLPPVGMGQLFSGVSQSLCFANRRRCVQAG